MASQSYNNIWYALEDNEADAINMTMRSDLMTSIEKVVESWNVTQAESAKRLGLTRPRMNDLLRGKISKFSLEALTALAHRAGLTVKMTVKKSREKLAA
jgi:predicted XRE-type DNA-binding protein